MVEDSNGKIDEPIKFCGQKVKGHGYRAEAY